jgi:hypothetical protein
VGWVVRNLGILIATVAVGLSFATATLNRRQRRQDMFLRVHEMLIDIEMQRGRRLLYQCGRDGRLPPEESDDFARISRALSVHNTVAVYVRRGIVPRRWILEGWQNTLCDMRHGAMLFIAYRQQTYGWHVWRELDSLITLAEKKCLHASDSRPHSAAPTIPRYKLGTEPMLGRGVAERTDESNQAHN